MKTRIDKMCNVAKIIRGESPFFTFYGKQQRIKISVSHFHSKESFSIARTTSLRQAKGNVQASQILRQNLVSRYIWRLKFFKNCRSLKNYKLLGTERFLVRLCSLVVGSLRGKCVKVSMTSTTKTYFPFKRERIAQLAKEPLGEYSNIILGSWSSSVFAMWHDWHKQSTVCRAESFYWFLSFVAVWSDKLCSNFCR